MPSPSYKEKHTLPIVPDAEREWALDRPSGEALGVIAKPAALTDDSQIASSPILVGRGSPVASGFDRSEAPDAGGQPVIRYSTVRFITVFYALTLSTFLFALDQLMVATAIPKITDQFNSLTQVSWIANSFFLTMLAFTSAYSQFLTIFPSKHVLLCAICAFELGSLICGVAPNMLALIFGRAISGFGGTGIFASSIIVLSEMTTLKERPMYIGFMGISFTIASVLGPLIGGVLSDHISWRWCFYINLPIGGIAFALLSVLVKTQYPYGRAQTYGGYGLHMLRQLAQCDLIGVAVALCWGGVSILGLEWGGVTRSWDDGSVIACLVMSVVLAVLFVSWEAFMGENAMLPLNLFKSKTLRGAAIVSVFGWASFIISVYYLSVGLQAAYKMSATAAGLHLLPLIIVEMVAIVLAGRLVFHINTYFVILLGPAFMVVGCGLLYSITSDHPIARLMGGEVFIGLGMGMFLQNVIVVTQYEFRDQPHLMTAATGSITLMGYIGRLIGVSTAGSVFENMLQVNIHKYAPDVPQSLIIAVMKAADALWKIVPPSDRSVVLQAYIKTLKTVFVVGVSTGGLAFVAALFMPKSRMDLSHDGEPEIQDVERRAGTHVMVDSSEVAIQVPKVETQKVPSPLGDALGLKDDGSPRHETAIVTFPASSAVRS